MNISQQLLGVVLGLTLLSPTFAIAQTSSWRLVATDHSGNQWYLGEVERIHTNLDNHHAARVKVILSNGDVTEIALGIDCENRTIINGKVLIQSLGPELLQHLRDQNTFAEAMINAVCKDKRNSGNSR